MSEWFRVRSTPTEKEARGPLDEAATDGGRELYNCDTPGCSNSKQVVTPDGYVCHQCANQLVEEYEDQDHDPRLMADGGER